MTDEATGRHPMPPFLGIIAFAATSAVIAVIFAAIIFADIPREKSTAEVLAEANRLLRIRCVEAYGAANLTWCLDRINANVQQKYDEEQKRAARR